MLYLNNGVSAVSEASRDTVSVTNDYLGKEKPRIDASKINEYLGRLVCLDKSIVNVTCESVHIYGGENVGGDPDKFYIAYNELAQFMATNECASEKEAVKKLEEYYTNESNVNMIDNLYVVVEVDESEVDSLCEDAIAGSRIAGTALSDMKDTLERLDADGVRIVRGPNLPAYQLPGKNQ